MHFKGVTIGQRWKINMINLKSFLALLRPIVKEIEHDWPYLLFREYKL